MEYSKTDSDLMTITDEIFHNLQAIRISTIVWLFKSIALVFIQSLYCEKLYTTVDEAQSACIQLLKNRNCSSKNILSVIIKLFIRY